MTIWNAISSLFAPAKELAEVFTPNAERSAERGHVERLKLGEQDLASLAQFAAEFQPRPSQTGWDSFVDGLNRLPRPTITLGILGLFVLAPIDPVRFLEIASAYERMPDGFWALLSIIIAFYFGGRMQFTRQQMEVKGGALNVAKDLLAVREELRSLEQPKTTLQKPRKTERKKADLELSYRHAQTQREGASPSNRVIVAWNARGRPHAAIKPKAGNG